MPTAYCCAYRIMTEISWFVACGYLLRARIKSVSYFSSVQIHNGRNRKYSNLYLRAGQICGPTGRQFAHNSVAGVSLSLLLCRARRNPTVAAAACCVLLPACVVYFVLDRCAVVSVLSITVTVIIVILTIITATVIITLTITNITSM